MGSINKSRTRKHKRDDRCKRMADRGRRKRKKRMRDRTKRRGRRYG